jgi:hypothetical protein
MAYPKSSATGSSTSKRGSSAAASLPTKSVPATKPKTQRALAAKSAATPAGKLKAAERPAIVELGRDRAGALSYITVY